MDSIVPPGSCAVNDIRILKTKMKDASPYGQFLWGAWWSGLIYDTQLGDDELLRSARFVRVSPFYITAHDGRGTVHLPAWMGT